MFLRFSFNEVSVVAISHDANKALHLLGSRISNRVPIHFTFVAVSSILIAFSKNQNLRNIVHAELFAQLFLSEAVNCAYFNDSIKFGRQLYVLVLKVLTFFEFWIEKVKDPNFLSSVKLEDRAKV